MPRPLQSELSGFSDSEILARVKTLVGKERAATLEILTHLNEVERRRLYLSLGYPSLFEYCTRHLGYSSSAAGRRIHAARSIRDFPEVYAFLEKNEVTLITVPLVASILTRENRNDLLLRIRNKSQREVEAIVADYRPPVAFRDRTRPVSVVVARPRGTASVSAGCSCPSTPSTGSGISPNMVNAPTGPLAGSIACSTIDEDEPGKTTADADDCVSKSASTSPAPRIERKLLVQFLASEAFMEKFEEVRALLTNKLGKMSYEDVLEVVLDAFLEKQSPKRKSHRREKRRQVRTKATREKTNATTSPSQPPKAVVPSEHTRHIPAAVRDKVFVRDKGRCAYIGMTGERCGATHGLQIDHIVPYGRGGRNTADNLRLLCAKHNRMEAVRIYGSSAIRRFQRKGTEELSGRNTR